MLALRLPGLETVPLIKLLRQHPVLLFLRLLKEPAKFASWSEPKYCCTLFELRTMFGTADRESQVGDWRLTSMVVLLLILV